MGKPLPPLEMLAALPLLAATALAQSALRPVPPAAGLRFRYLGSSGNELPLASGMARRQIGLKLRARDACNDPDAACGGEAFACRSNGRRSYQGVDRWHLGLAGLGGFRGIERGWTRGLAVRQCSFSIRILGSLELIDKSPLIVPQRTRRSRMRVPILA